jgi:putative ABC transport system ATP-binding protein
MSGTREPRGPVVMGEAAESRGSGVMSDGAEPLTESVAELVGVTKAYPRGVEAVRGVDLRIGAGEAVAVVGPSGSGKSTLLHLLGTLDRPSSGTVRVAGHDVARLPDRRLAALRASTIGFVFQHFHLTPGMTALDNVADGLLYARTPSAGGGTRGRVPPAERRRRAAIALERVGLAHRLDHRPHQLSGGEQQRVAVARAVVGEPALLLADEPTGNLDSASGAEVLRVLFDVATTLVVITHDAGLAAALPRRVRMRDGQIVEETS